MTRVLLPLATVLLALYFEAVNIFLAPVYLGLFEALDLTTPLPARLVTDAATNQWILMGLLVVALLCFWWQQPHIRTRVPVPWLAPRTILHLTNLVLVLAVLAQGTLFLRFASDGPGALRPRFAARTTHSHSVQ
jgi:glucan phosphoethanolaminetransferase (alkaline phosphatase superfamily)